jgi:hypothetical protein
MASRGASTTRTADCDAATTSSALPSQPPLASPSTTSTSLVTAVEADGPPVSNAVTTYVWCDWVFTRMAGGAASLDAHSATDAPLSSKLTLIKKDSRTSASSFVWRHVTHTSAQYTINASRRMDTRTHQRQWTRPHLH